MLCFNFSLNLLLVGLDRNLKRMGFLLKLILLKFKESLFFGSVEELLLNFFYLILVFVMASPDFLNSLADLKFLTIDAILVSLMIISLLSQLFPSGLCLLSDDLG